MERNNPYPLLHLLLRAKHIGTCGQEPNKNRESGSMGWEARGGDAYPQRAPQTHRQSALQYFIHDTSLRRKPTINLARNALKFCGL
jgi:hypothetical protein